MNLIELSIKRPVFITCLFLLSLLVGILSLQRIGVEEYPEVVFPNIFVGLSYTGAGPKELESVLVKPLEDELSTLSGLKNLTSTMRSESANLRLEFNQGVNLSEIEQAVRERAQNYASSFPKNAKISYIQKVNLNEEPILSVAISSDLKSEELSRWVEKELKPHLEQIESVGMVELSGLSKKEVNVALIPSQLRIHDLHTSDVLDALTRQGQNYPAGRIESNKESMNIRTVGAIQNLQQLNQILVSFRANERPIQLSSVAEIKEGLSNKKSYSLLNGADSINLSLYRKSGSNLVSLVDAVKAQFKKFETDSRSPKGLKFLITEDGSDSIRKNILDVKESLVIGILLTILVVYFFLGSVRSTFITTLAIPNSILGAIAIMSLCGFTLNVMTLLAISIAIGLLVDDAIVVRENIFKHLEEGKSAKQAALDGTKEVILPVIATTATVIAVFGPIAYLDGFIGQFFKQFGLTICFALLVSCIDAFTMAPMLSAQFANENSAPSQKAFLGFKWKRLFGGVVRMNERMLFAFQTFLAKLERSYLKLLGVSMHRPKTILLLALILFAAGILSLSRVPKTFMAPRDTHSFDLNLETPSGTSLIQTKEIALQYYEQLKLNPAIKEVEIRVGGSRRSAQKARFDITLHEDQKPKVKTEDVNQQVEKTFADFKLAKLSFGNQSDRGKAIYYDIVASDYEQALSSAQNLIPQLKKMRDVGQAEVSVEDPSQELQIVISPDKAKLYGVNSAFVATELAQALQGEEVFTLKADGIEIPVKVKLKDFEESNIEILKKFEISNINQRRIPLGEVAELSRVTSPNEITRTNKLSSLSIKIALAKDSKLGQGQLSDLIDKKYKDGEFNMSANTFINTQNSNSDYKDLMKSAMKALLLAVLLMYLVLASLYESFKLPILILMIIPLAASGAFLSLFASGSYLDLFSMIGCILLMGVSAKNSILLVDAIEQKLRDGVKLQLAIQSACTNRLRPILMTSAALIAGMIPVALGLNEVSKYRTSMGIAVIGGLISSTLLSLVVVPAIYILIGKYKDWRGSKNARFQKSSSLEGSLEVNPPRSDLIQ